MLPHFDHKLVVALIGGVFPGTFGFNHHAHTVARLERGNILHRGTKICHIQTPTQAFRHAGFQKLNDQVLTLLANINADLVVRKIDDDAA